MMEIDRPKIEGSVGVADGRRRIGFAEYGSATGRAVIWLHGTPGARRQIPIEARAWAADNHIRLIGLDRPGVGSSTAHRYAQIADFPTDLEVILEALGIDEFAIIGISGGGPYTLATAHAFPHRVIVAGVVGGVAPTVGPEAIGGGAMALGSALAPVVRVAGAPLGKIISSVLSVARPVAEPAIKAYGRLSPRADREVLARPEVRAFFLDDLLHGGSRRMDAPFADIVVFARDWGFRVADVTTPVLWWHGDDDNIIPFEHGQHMAALLPDCTFYELPGESHLSTFGAMSTQFLADLVLAWDKAKAHV
ncbi:MAG: alpha/beta hydrolase [Gordonia sp. (in: high G+C Gram-positive bacteria)]